MTADASVTTTARVAKTGRPPASLGFDVLMLLVSFWPLAGVFADSWAHENIPQLETFFTPWHAILYSGAFAVSLTVGVVLWRHHEQGYSWRNAMPAGYEMTVVACGLLILAGLGDMTWHLLFGIERDIAALLSPTHLLIVISITLILAGPLRSALNRPDLASLRGAQQIPMLVSTLFAYTMVAIYTQFANPFVYRWPAYGDVDLFANAPYPPIDNYLSQSLGVLSFMVYSAVLMAFVLFIVRRWQPIFGTLTVFMGFSVLFINALQGQYDLVPAALAAGLVGDILLLVLCPATGGTLAFRVFAAAFPVVVLTGYMINLEIVHGIVWIVHLWVGAIVMGGIVGWLVSYLMVPPERVPTA